MCTGVLGAVEPAAPPRNRGCPGAKQGTTLVAAIAVPRAASLLDFRLKMLYLLSPAKSLDYETPVPAGVARTEPLFVQQSAQLVEVLRKQSARKIGALMKISDRLAALNVARYHAWSAEPAAQDARQAAYAFNGDVYEGLQIRSLGKKEREWAQQHVCILSGLYGVLRPLDAIQPYRLEMGIRLKTRRGADLYHFWGTGIAEHLNERLAGSKDPIVVNLASQEYFKSVDRQALKARVIECVFEDWKGGRYKIISFYAKRARGLMARYAAQHRVASEAGLRSFDLEGYRLAEEACSEDRLVFRRRGD